MAIRKVFEDEQQTAGINTALSNVEQQPAVPTSETAPATNVSGGQSATISGQPTASPKQPASSGLFTNLRKFISANKGAGSQIAQKGVEQATTSAQNIGQALSEKKAQFQQNISDVGKTIAQEQQKGLGIIESAGTVPSQTAEYQALQQRSSQFSPEQAAQFDLTPQQKQAQQLGTSAEKAETASGRFSLLRDMFKSPERRYTQGSQLLDTAFLQGSPEAKKALLEGYQTQAAESAKAVGQAEQEKAANLQRIQEENKALQETLSSRLGQARADVESATAQRGAAALQQRENVKKLLQQAISEGTLENIYGQLDEKTRQQLGISADIPTGEVDAGNLEQVLDYARRLGTVRALGGQDIAGYTKGLEANVGLQDLQSFLATDPERARISALAELAGEQAGQFLPEARAQGLEEGLFGLQLGNLGEESQAAVQQYVANRRREEPARFQAIWEGEQGGLTPQTLEHVISNFTPDLDTPRFRQSLQNLDSNKNALPKYETLINQGMATPQDIAEYNDVLDQINTVNNFYSELSNRSGGYLSSPSTIAHEGAKLRAKAELNQDIAQDIYGKLSSNQALY